MGAQPIVVVGRKLPAAVEARLAGLLLGLLITCYKAVMCVIQV